MSEAHAQDQHDAPHEGPIKTPKQLVLAVFFSFVVPIVGIIMLAQFVAVGDKEAPGSQALQADATARRIHPVGSIEIKDASDVASLKTGEQVFAAQCTACHTAGVAGAPKIGDAAAWAPRLGQGFDALVHSALKGKGNMGPQGGGDFSDFEISRAVVYMANKGGGKFAEPALPAAAGASAPADGAAAATTAASAADAAPAASAP